MTTAIAPAWLNSNALSTLLKEKNHACLMFTLNATALVSNLVVAIDLIAEMLESNVVRDNLV